METATDGGGLLNRPDGGGRRGPSTGYGGGCRRETANGTANGARACGRRRGARRGHGYDSDSGCGARGEIWAIEIGDASQLRAACPRDALRHDPRRDELRRERHRRVSSPPWKPRASPDVTSHRARGAPTAPTALARTGSHGVRRNLNLNFMILRGTDPYPARQTTQSNQNHRYPRVNPPKMLTAVITLTSLFSVVVAQDLPAPAQFRAVYV